MIGQCFNPECGEEMHYLSQGSVYAWETGEGPDFQSEFFWLCPTCSEAFRVASNGSRKPSLTPKSLRIGFERKGSRVRRVFATGCGNAREA